MVQICVWLWINTYTMLQGGGHPLSSTKHSSFMIYLGMVCWHHDWQKSAFWGESTSIMVHNHHGPLGNSIRFSNWSSPWNIPVDGPIAKYRWKSHWILAPAKMVPFQYGEESKPMKRIPCAWSCLIHLGWTEHSKKKTCDRYKMNQNELPIYSHSRCTFAENWNTTFFGRIRIYRSQLWIVNFP